MSFWDEEPEEDLSCMFGEGQEKEANYLRQLDIIDPDDMLPVTIIGCGAIGSAIGIIGGKMGLNNMILIDGDSVEQHNIPNQYFGYEHLGRNKADALREEILRYTPFDMQPNIVSIPEMFDEETSVYTSIVVMAVDGLDTRRMVFNRLSQLDEVNWVIDIRMGAEYYEIYIIDMGNDTQVEEYLSTLEGEILPAPCTARSVIYTVATASSHSVNMMKRLMKGYDVPKCLREDLSHYGRYTKIVERDEE
jgi:molybdopterin/thiamine biosynthesis adenylyltransferase